MTYGKQKLKPSFPGALGQTQEKTDGHGGGLGHATIALFAIPMFGESMSTIILRYQQRGMRQRFHF